MSSPMFDGQYRSKPLVSLRGASKQVERGGLLEKAHRDRESRETLRRQKLAALAIQATYRGYRVRIVVNDQLRSRFEQLCTTCSSANDVLLLSKLALVFYRKHCDGNRLIKLCQKWIQFRADLSSLALSAPTCLLHLSRVLTWSCDSVSSPHINPTLLLRTIEVFLDPATYQHDHAHIVIRQLCNHLIQHHFFQSILSVLQIKAPPPEDADATPTPLVNSLLGYLTRPLIALPDSSLVYESLAKEVLSSAHSCHVTYYVLPHLSRSDLNVLALVQAILSRLSSWGVASSSGGVAPSLELLFAVIRLVHPHLSQDRHDPDEQLLHDYLHLVALLLSHTPSSHVTVEEEEGEEDDMSIGDVDMEPLASQDAMLRHCLATIGGEELPRCLQRKKPLPLPLLDKLCTLCYQLIRHSHTLLYNRTRLFQSLALNPDLLSQMWLNLSQMIIKRTFGDPVSCLQQLARGLALPQPYAVNMVSALSTFSVLFNLYLDTLHDAEFYREKEVPVGSHMPFSLGELAAMAAVLRDVFITLHMEKHLPPTYSLSRATQPTKPHPQEWLKLKCLLQELLCALYQRDCRRPYCPEGHWVAPGLSTATIPPELFIQNEGEEEGGGDVISASPHVLKYAELLRSTSFVFPFVERVRFFRMLVTHSRTGVQGRYQDFLMGPSHALTVRRDHVYEDAFAELARDADLRSKLRVTFVNAQGLSEAGIDGGGVFREFLSEVLKMGFDPNRGYFSTTPEGQLYPNPQSHLISEDSDLHYRFLGSILGKSLYEGQLVELPFAGFFLCKLAAKGHGFVGTHHLASFDPDLYRNLLSLKYYDGDIEDLALNFVMATEELGQSKVYELKRGGTEVSVTKTNCVEYIHLMAHFRLNVQLHRQFLAFRAGLQSVIPSHWLSLFSQNELQVLISGAQVPINVNDLRLNTTYSGDYKDDHDSIALFWEVVDSFSEEQKRQLLKFVTSCSRPPLLGFKELHPPFKISPSVGESHLPSASTCMNLLKLPMFRDKDVMRGKLVYAIQSGAGFELS